MTVRGLILAVKILFMNTENSKKKPVGEVILTGLDKENQLVIEKRIDVVDYYEMFHPILDEGCAYRNQHKIRYVKGRIYDYDGNLDQEFTNEYDESGQYIRGRSVFADGTISPVTGADEEGPTAVLGSAAAVGTPYNQLLNQKFQPDFLKGDSKEKFYSYLKAWGDLGISHIQFNIVDRETLLKAQKNPGDHRNLIVRVAGYSAYFVDLSKGLQDSIIDRTEQAMRR